MDLDLIFKAYDIRGRTDNGELDEEVARRVGAAFARFTGAATIAVGHDCRLSSPSLRDASSTASPVRELTCSHWGGGDRRRLLRRWEPPSPRSDDHRLSQPPEYNGIKLCREGAVPVGADTGLSEVRRLAEQDQARAADPGQVEPFDPTPGYVNHLFSLVERGSARCGWPQTAGTGWRGPCFPRYSRG